MSEYTKRQEDIDLAIVKSDISFIKEKVKEIDNDLKTDYVSQKFFDSKFDTLEDKVSFLTKVLYSAVGIIVVFVITQLLGLIPGK